MCVCIHVFLLRNRMHIHNAFRLIIPVYDMGEYICKLNAFMKQAEYAYNTV